MYSIQCQYNEHPLPPVSQCTVAHHCESCTFFESCETEARFPEQLQAAASLSLSCCCCWHQIPSLPASAALVLPNSSPASAALHLAPQPNSSKHAVYFNSWDFSASFTIFLSTLTVVLCGQSVDPVWQESVTCFCATIMLCLPLCVSGSRQKYVLQRSCRNSLLATKHRSELMWSPHCTMQKL